MVPLKRKETRCTLCSLGCHLGLSQSPHGNVEPGYVRDVPPMRRGVCNRGNMTAELLGLVGRVDAAKLTSGGRPRQVSLDEAMTALADAVRSDGATLIVDGNLPGEDVSAVLSLAAASKGKITAGVYLPFEDEAALQGLAASRASFLTPEALAGCDAVLVVGDAFATHPVISRPVHEIRKQNPRTPVVVVDSLKGRTSIFATHPLIVKPGGESRVLAAIASRVGVKDLGKLAVDVDKGACEAGVSAGALKAAADVIAGAKKPGVILRAEVGKAVNWDQVALLAGLIAAAKGSGVVACLTYGNALGSFRLAHGAGARLEKPGRTTIVLRTDVVSVLSKRLCETTLDGIRTLAASAPVQTPTLGAADIVLPMGFDFETGGTTVTGSGEVIRVDVVADPPGEAVSAGEIAMRLAKGLGISGVERKVDVKALEATPEVDAKAVAGRGQPGMPSTREDEFTAVTQSDAIHFHTGGLTALCAWPKYMATAPVAVLSAGDARSLGIADGDTVLLTSSEGEGAAVAEVVKEQTPGIVGLSSGFAGMRRLFSWDAAHRTGPVTVKIQKGAR